MKMRHYAIGALGYIGDKRAIPVLEAILKNKNEIEYIRGDAHHVIYQLDRKLGSRYAKYEDENDYLRMMSSAIKRKDAWLLEPTEEK